MGYRTEKKKLQEFSQVSQENKKRVLIFTLMVVMSLIAMIGRLAYIQLIKGEDFAMRASNQWTKEIIIGVERGKIYDRNKIPLTNRYEYDYLFIFPELFSMIDEDVELICKVTGISKDDFKNHRAIGSKPVELKIQSHDEDALKKALSLKGVFTIKRSERYDSNRLATHVVGYINKIDNRGEKGLEKQYDVLLKDNQQYKLGAMVDAQKRIIPGLGYKIIESPSSKNRYNIVTTLDYNIQRVVEEELNLLSQNSSVVILDAKTGEVLAMASRPDFEPDNVAAYLDSNNKELYNRAIQLTYPPGSTFKLVVAMAALEYTPNLLEDRYLCKGYEEIGDTTIKCSSYETGGHGEINFEEALALSCNSVFIQIGQQLGGEKIIEMAKKVGLGSLTNIELPEEVTGQLATEDYMKGAGIGNISIGQGTLEVTPLQMAKLTSIIANNGVDKKVRIIKKIINEDGAIIEDLEVENYSQAISRSTAQILQQMMEKVVREGTGKIIELDHMGGAAGKTGSAEAIRNNQKIVHAWFTGYFPLREPKYVVSIIVENGGSGGKVAAPLFSKIIQRIELGQY